MREIDRLTKWQPALRYNRQRNNPKMLKCINSLTKGIQRQPFEGVGKPEPLKHSFSGYWSRRITDEHRIIY